MIFLRLIFADTNRSFFVTPEKSKLFRYGSKLMTHARYWGIWSENRTYKLWKILFINFLNTGWLLETLLSNFLRVHPELIRQKKHYVSPFFRGGVIKYNVSKLLYGIKFEPSLIQRPLLEPAIRNIKAIRKYLEFFDHKLTLKYTGAKLNALQWP